MKTVVLGVGNLLLGDEGFGVHASRALLEEEWPEHVAIHEIGTAIIDALPAMEKADRIIVLDAVVAGKPAGTVYRMALEQFSQNPCIASMHGVDLPRVLALRTGEKEPQVLVIGVEPRRIEWSMELSPEVDRAMQTALAIVRDELASP